MLNDIEQKADKISMAHSLELRVPYLDVKIAKLANSIPSKYLVNKYRHQVQPCARLQNRSAG